MNTDPILQHNILLPDPVLRQLYSPPAPLPSLNSPFSIARHSKFHDREDYDLSCIIRPTQSASQLRQSRTPPPRFLRRSPLPTTIASASEIDPLDEIDRKFPKITHPHSFDPPTISVSVHPPRSLASPAPESSPSPRSPPPSSIPCRPAAHEPLAPGIVESEA